MLCNSTRTSGMERGHGRWTMGWKRKRAEVRQGGGSEVEEEGGSEKEGTKKRGTAEEGREGRPSERGAAFAP